MLNVMNSISSRQEGIDSKAHEEIEGQVEIRKTYLKTSGFQHDVVLKINLTQMNKRWECFSGGLMEGH